LKPSSLPLSATAVALLAAAFTATTFAQAPAPPQQPAEGAPAPHHHEEPAPTNLKVLPKTMTGEQVHELMHKWEAALGTECSTCHTADPNNIGPNGKPRLNFADDSKKEKAAARIMYKMVEDINTQYVNMIDNSGVPVTCGTCHRGHLSPELFVPTPGHEHHEHGAPPAPSGDKPSIPH
jgi:Photosynthetic reaction centre cytochrome C subunit